jgi:hypothetical protein
MEWNHESRAGSLGGASKYVASSLTTWLISELDALESLPDDPVLPSHQFHENKQDEAQDITL